MRKSAVMTLINERGNDVSVAALMGPEADEVTVTMSGPTSDTTNTMTEDEAKALYAALGHVLGI